MTGDEPQLPADWSEAETWAWGRIAAGEIADFNARDREGDPDFKDLDPAKADGWPESRRLRAKAFLQRILTDKAFVAATPFGGVRILGALIDDAPIMLEHARLLRLLWLEKSRILVPVNARFLRVDGGLSLGASFVAREVELAAAKIGESFHLSRATVEGPVSLNGATVEGAVFLRGGATFKGVLDLVGARIGSALDMSGSTFEGPVNLNGATVQRSVLLCGGATFKSDLNLGGASIGSALDMSSSTFEGPVNLNSATVQSAAFLSCGATFKGELDLIGARIGSALDMSGSTFEGELNLSGARIGSQLGMIGSTFEGPVNLNGATVQDAAFLRGGAIFKGELNLVNASIGSTLGMIGSTFEGPVNLNGATVQGAAFLRGGATFKGDVNLVSARIGSHLEMDGSTFEGELNLSGARIGSTLGMIGSTFEGPVSLNGATVQSAAFLSCGATFKGELDLIGAGIGSNLEMQGSTFEGSVSLSGATVQGAAFLKHGATFKGEMNLVGASIGSNLDVSGGEFLKSVDLTGARIGGEFRLGSSRHLPARWDKDAALVLRNTHCGALQDRWDSETNNAWPTNLELGGFTYARLGGLYSEGAAADMLARPATSYVAWLARDATFSPQPYEYLAQAFRQAGEPEKATDILYAARERRRHTLWTNRAYGKWLGVSLLNWTIGYGLGGRYFFAALWVIGFSLIGMGLLIQWGAQTEKAWLPLLLASFDNLLPLIELDKAHEALIYGDPTAVPPLAQPHWLKICFYGQKIAGLVLGSFLVAGLAGLTQRN